MESNVPKTKFDYNSSCYVMQQSAQNPTDYLLVCVCVCVRERERERESEREREKRERARERERENYVCVTCCVAEPNK